MDDILKKRIEHLKSHIKMRQVVDHFKVKCASPGDQVQLHCPFHGEDMHASAKIYDTGTMYCWKCSKVWDIISFVQDFVAKAGKILSFIEAVKYLENSFSIPKFDAGKVENDRKDYSFLYGREDISPPPEDLEKLFDKIDRLLVTNKINYTLEDYTRYFHIRDLLFADYKAKQDVKDKLTTLLKKLS